MNNKDDMRPYGPEKYSSWNGKIWNIVFGILNIQILIGKVLHVLTVSENNIGAPEIPNNFLFFPYCDSNIGLFSKT